MGTTVQTNLQEGRVCIRVDGTHFWGLAFGGAFEVLGISGVENVVRSVRWFLVIEDNDSDLENILINTISLQNDILKKNKHSLI